MGVLESWVLLYATILHPELQATGPNMSGKSTLMRAVGAAALLANCGFMVHEGGE